MCFNHLLVTVHRKMSCSKPKYQHIDWTLQEKIEILKKLEYGMKDVDVCRQYGICYSTLSAWKKGEIKVKGHSRYREST